MGVSVENADYQYRVDHLRRTKAKIKFLSLEPLLGPLDNLNLRGIDWAIAGGESGPGARPMPADWVRSTSVMPRTCAEYASQEEKLMGLKEITEVIAAFKGAMDLLKAASSMLPKGQKKDEVDAKIIAAQEALKRADAELARNLGYKLCQCTFPPQIMLWQQAQSAHVCGKCGDQIKVYRGGPGQAEDYDPLGDWRGAP